MASHKRPPDTVLDALDDDQVVMRLRDNPAEFRVLYERYFQRVYGYCLKRTSNQQVAEDLSSEVFIKVMSKIESYQPGNFPAWLFRIAHNIVVDHYRKQKEVIAIDSLPLEGDSQMSSRVDNRLLAEELLSELLESERELLSLRFGAGLSAPEISEITGKSVSAVRVQIYRILKRLRDRYESTMGGKS